MKGTVFGGEIAWFAGHFYENSTPNCEGCESKKCNFAGSARTRTRERDAKDENVEHEKYSSEVRFILLQAPNKNIGRFPKNVGDFFKNVGSFSVYLPRFFFTLQCATNSTLVFHPLHNEYFRLIVLGFVHLFLYDNAQKEVQRRNVASKPMAQPQSTLKRQSWVDCRARSAGGEGTIPMLGQSYSSRQ